MSLRSSLERGNVAAVTINKEEMGKALVKQVT